MNAIRIKQFGAITLCTFLFSGCALTDGFSQNSTNTTNSTSSNTSSNSNESGVNKTATGAIIGGLLGAAVGATTKGNNKFKRAAIGGALGAAVGGGIGYALDKQAKDVADELNTNVNNNPQAAIDPDNDLIVSNTDKYVKIMLRDTMVFPTNSSIPTPSASQKLSKIANVLQKYPDTIVQVVGFTDSRGTFEYNQKLSEERASNVANTIYSGGIQNQIYSKGCSYNKPIVANKTESDMALNRRVEVYLYQDQNSIIDACKY